MAMDGLPTFVALQISAGGYKEFPGWISHDGCSQDGQVPSHKNCCRVGKKHLRYYRYSPQSLLVKNSNFLVDISPWPTNQISRFRCSRHFVAVRSWTRRHWELPQNMLRNPRYVGDHHPICWKSRHWKPATSRNLLGGQPETVVTLWPIRLLPLEHIVSWGKKNSQ